MRRRTGKVQRATVARDAQEHFSSMLANPHLHPPMLLDAAAIHLIKTSRRHRLHLPVRIRESVCRNCWTHHVLSSKFRIRIKYGQRIKTCLNCGSIRRYGGGPKYHRNRAGGERDG